MSDVQDLNDLPARPRHRWAQFAVALAGVALFVGIRMALGPVLGREAPLLLLTVPVAIAGYVGGLAPGLVATIASAVMGTYFLLERDQGLWVTQPSDRARLVLFVVTGSIISVLCEAMRRARRHAEGASTAADRSEQNVRRAREEHGHAVTALRESEENFRLLVQGVRDYAIFLVNPDGHIATWNEGAKRLKGYPATEIIGKHIRAFYEPGDVKDGLPERNLHHAVERGVFQGQGWRLRRDGSRFYADVAITALRDNADTLRGFAKITRDITDRRAAEVALRESERQYRELAAALEARVSERTTQLEEANLQLEAFAYSVSHDLRAPLRAVQGFAQALLEDYGNKLDETGKEYAHRSVAAAAEMDRLIRDLLEYSRLGRVELPMQDVPVAQTIRAALAQLDAESRAPGNGVDVGAVDCTVRANGPVLGQVLGNLVSNAVKFVRPGDAPKVRVWCDRRPDGFVRVNVADNGIGIAPEHQARIFKVFERLHGTEEYPGTGIGLAIVRRGAERMGGRFGLESELGRGSTFWVEFPAAADVPAHAAAEQAAGAVPGGLPANGGEQ